MPYISSPVAACSVVDAITGVCGTALSVLITIGTPAGASVGKRTTMMTCMVTLNIPVPTWATDRFETLGGATISGQIEGVPVDLRIDRNGVQVEPGARNREQEVAVEPPPAP